MNPSPLDQVYDPENFRQSGHQMVDFLADQLERMTGAENDAVLKWQSPEEALGKVDSWIQSDNFFDKVFEHCIHLHDPRYLGHQLMPPAPIASLAGLFSDFVNNGMGVYEMGIAGSAMDQWIVKNVGQRLGFGDDCGGVMTCGGTLANLTALLAARANQVPGSWDAGMIPPNPTAPEPLALMVSDQSHYCVDRAAKIMGWGNAGVVPIASDDRFRMRTDQLERALEKAHGAGLRVIAIVGSACSTSTGSHDDLRAIGEFAKEFGLWFHVDGAHGAAAIFSSKYRSLLDGIELANSVTLDFHKVLMTPAVTSALLFRNGKTAYQSFSQQADYLLANDGQDEWFDMARRTFECTKTMLSLKVCSIVAKHGWEIFDENVTRLYDLAREAARLLGDAEDFELATDPETNIVCFRYLGELGSRNAINKCALNASIRKSLIENGPYYIVQTTLRGEVWLRTTISNPLTDMSHFRGLLECIRRTATAAT